MTVRLLHLPVLLLASVLALPCSAEPVLAIKAEGTLQAAFAPWDDIEGLIVDALGQAKQQILVQAYLLTSKKIGAALINAHRRSVDVRVLADERQLARTDDKVIAELAAAGVPVWLETAYQNAHNKIIVIDAATPQATVITGSYNFTWTAQHKNAENVLVARNNPALAARYVANWEKHRKDAIPYRK